MTISAVGTYVRNSSATGTIANVNGQAVAIGDLLISFLFWDGINVSVPSPAIADNVNAGAWNLPGTLQYYSAGQLIKSVVGWIRCDTVGTPTVTASSLGSQGTLQVLVQYTGFATGHPSLVSADIVQTNGGAGSTSPATSLASNSANPELMFMAAGCRGGQNFGSFTGSMTTHATADADDCYADQIMASTGNAISWGATITSATWVTQLMGFQDSPPAGQTATIAWVT